MMRDAEIRQIRDASRRLVRELGFMQPTIAGTNLHASAVHALIEIGRRDAVTAADLSSILNLEKSSISRMLRKLVEAGEIAESASDQDGRAKPLTLTGQGRQTLAAIDAFAESQVSSAIERLTGETRRSVRAGLAAYAEALETQRMGKAALSQSVDIANGYRTGLIGRCAEMHARYYARTAGFGAFFEGKVIGAMAEFILRLDRPVNGLWTALDGDSIVGTVAIDGEGLGAGVAHLRWFIVEEGYRGRGVGRQLLSEAASFCDRQRFPEIHLWTFKGLDAAKRLYEAFGFTLAEEFAGVQWGAEVTEQRYIRKCPAS